MLALLASLSAFVGTVLQGISGTGVALVVAPFLTILLGPVDGIFLTNLINGFGSLILSISFFKDIHWKRYIGLFIFSLVGEIIGAYLIQVVPVAWLQIFIGFAVALSMIAVWVSRHNLPVLKAPWLIVLTGVMAGFLMSTAGIGAPATVIYAQFIRWDQDSFAATMQPLFATLAFSSFFMKRLQGIPFEASYLDGRFIVTMMTTLVCAAVMGYVLSNHVRAKHARNLAFFLAGAGAVVAMGQGFFDIAS